MKVDYKEHYNSDYFQGKKTFKDAYGRTQTYHGPSLTWEGFEHIAETLHKLYPGVKSILDIGCSGGDLVSRFAHKNKAEPWGIDISDYAAENCVPRMKGRIAVADITTTPDLGEKFPEKYDLVMSTDLLEHIYREDLDKTFDWIMSKGHKHFFFLVATAGYEKEVFVHEKGKEVPREHEGTAVSGHVHVVQFGWWEKYFREKGLRIDYQRMYLFQMKRESIPDWKNTGGWSMNCTFFLEKK